LRESYWFESLDDQQIVYFHYNHVRNDDRNSFASFINQLFEAIDANEAKALVIDIRVNDGGSTPEYYPLLRRLIAGDGINSPGRLFVIIGRKTFSAAMNLATDLEHWTEAIFVGEPTGESPNFIGENKFFKLPYTGISVSVSDRYHQRGASDSTDKRVWIAPHIAAELSSRDFKYNIDPAMDAILAFVESREVGSTEP
jgi:hypothetical protein